MLKGSGKCGSLIGWFFETYSIEQFSKGGQFELKALSDLNLSNISITLSQGAYIPSRNSNSESVDGYWQDKNSQILYLFQVTRSYSHPVNASGIIALIKELNISVDELAIKLIFVVPYGMASNFSKQTINMEPLNIDAESDVAALNGVGP